MESQAHGAGHQAVDHGLRHADAGDGLQYAHARVDLGVLKEVLPEHGHGPAGHDVGEDEDGGDEFLGWQVRSGDEPGHHPAEHHGHDAGQRGHQGRLAQGHPELGAGVVVFLAGQKLGPMVERPGTVLHALLIDPDGLLIAVDLEGADEERAQRQYHGQQQEDQEDNGDHVGRLGEIGPEAVAQRFFVAHARASSLSEIARMVFNRSGEGRSPPLQCSWCFIRFGGSYLPAICMLMNLTAERYAVSRYSTSSTMHCSFHTARAGSPSTEGMFWLLL